jgi:hypothetical protein
MRALLTLICGNAGRDGRGPLLNCQDERSPQEGQGYSRGGIRIRAGY